MGIDKVARRFVDRYRMTIKDARVLVDHCRALERALGNKTVARQVANHLLKRKTWRFRLPQLTRVVGRMRPNELAGCTSVDKLLLACDTRTGAIATVDRNEAARMAMHEQAMRQCGGGFSQLH